MYNMIAKSPSPEREIYMAQLAIKQYESVRTTVNLPAELVRRSQRFVDDGTVPSRNALIVAALEHFVEHLERRAIDAQFAAMADDADYQSLSLDLADEFAESDWEALELGEVAWQ